MGQSVLIGSYELAHPGGGELHALAIGAAAAQLGYDVTCLSHNTSSKDELQRWTGLQLDSLCLGEYSNRSKSRTNFDLLVHVTNGNWRLPRAYSASRRVAMVYCPIRSRHLLPESVRYARRRIISRGAQNLLWRPFRGYNDLWAISEFTHGVISRSHGLDSQVLYPPLLQQPDSVRPYGARERVIAVIGRISPEKQQLALIDAFERSSLSRKGWHLRIIGGEYERDRAYVEVVRERSRTLNIWLEMNTSRSTVVNALSTSRLLWHGMGLGCDPAKRPTQVEAFGMVILEGLAFGCVPVAPSVGGPVELLPESLLASELGDYGRITESVDTMTILDLADLSASLRARSQGLDWSAFTKRLNSLLNSQF